MLPGDEELVRVAFAADPARYRALSEEVVDEVVAEVRDPFGERSRR